MGFESNFLDKSAKNPLEKLEKIASNGSPGLRHKVAAKFEMMKGGHPVVEPYSEPSSVY